MRNCCATAEEAPYPGRQVLVAVLGTILWVITPPPYSQLVSLCAAAVCAPPCNAGTHPQARRSRARDSYRGCFLFILVPCPCSRCVVMGGVQAELGGSVPLDSPLTPLPVLALPDHPH